MPEQTVFNDVTDAEYSKQMKAGEAEQCRLADAAIGAAAEEQRSADAIGTTPSAEIMTAREVGRQLAANAAEAVRATRDERARRFAERDPTRPICPPRRGAHAKDLMDFSARQAAALGPFGMANLMMAVSQEDDHEERKAMLREFAQTKYLAQQARKAAKPVAVASVMEGPAVRGDGQAKIGDLAKAPYRPGDAAPGGRARAAASPPVGSAEMAATALLRHNGRAWVQLRPRERAALHRDDPEKYHSMRMSAAVPMTFAQLRPIERAEMRRDHPQQYADMQASPDRYHLVRVPPGTFTDHLPRA